MASRPAAHVVAGLLLDGQKVFLTRRPTDRHQGGKWEFPGGKLEPNETALAGLRRELHEELGIVVAMASPFLVVRHVYPELDVLLDVWIVERYEGEPQGREGQEVRWASIENLDPAEFPAADRPILRRLQLPPVYAISDAARLGVDVFAARLDEALAAGLRLLQLREPGLAPESFVALAKRCAQSCRRHGALFLVNGEAALAEACGADGVHLSASRLRSIPARPLGPDRWVAASCHNSDELRLACEIGVDFVVLSPVCATRSHPNAIPLGWDRFASLCRETPLPVYALGGMNIGHLSHARAAGAQGIAMMSGLWSAPDIEVSLPRPVH